LGVGFLIPLEKKKKKKNIGGLNSPRWKEAPITTATVMVKKKKITPPF